MEWQVTPLEARVKTCRSEFVVVADFEEVK
jgi:hypothetical protein